MLQRILDLSSASLTLLLAGSLFLYFLTQWLCDPLRSIPGPFLARYTRLWYCGEIYRGTFELTNIRLHKTHGPIVRIAPNEYSVDDVDAAKTIYGHGTAFVKAPWYRVWMPPGPEKASLFSDLNPSRHATQKRKFAAAYSMSSLVSYEPFVDNCSTLISQRFSEVSAAGKTINLSSWLQCYAFDVIGEITFSSRFGFLDTGEDKAGVFQAIDTRGLYGCLIGVFSSLHSILYPLLPSSWGQGYITKFTLDRMEEKQKVLKDPRKNDRTGTPDFLTKFMQVHEADPQKMTRGDLATICQENIGAGSDTTAISLSSVFYHLLKHPSTYNRLRDEIDEAAKTGKLSDPITFKEAQGLRYLQAVIKEALRMHPATGLPLVRVVPAGGAVIAGHHFPAGATVGINAWVAHHNTSVYGEDADSWRPSRWLEFEKQGRAGDVEKYFFAFGMGSRTCIGKNISLLELSKLVPQLLRKFDFALDESLDGRTWVTSNRWFVKQTDFLGKVKTRQAIV